MIPRVAKAGKSFKGAAQYYLHDKGAQTSERVGFTETVNLPTNDTHRATAHMIDTALHSNELKRQAGMKATGRKLTNPVYSYSLAWHPSQQPDKAEQIASAKATLKHLGLQDHQAIIVAHNDTDHPHVHVIANRVHPETGIALNMGNDQLKLSEWAQKHEQDRGHVFCVQRVENNHGRKSNYVKGLSLSRYENYAWKKADNQKLWKLYKADKLDATKNQKAQIDALWQQKEERISARKIELKELYRPKWRELFIGQKAALAKYDNKLSERLKFAMKIEGSSKVLSFARAIVSDAGNRQLFLKQQAAERRTLREEQKRTISDSMREIGKAWKYDRQQLKDQHKAQNADRLDHYRGISDLIWDKAKHLPSKSFEKPTRGNEEKKQARRSTIKKKLRSDRTKARGRTRKPRNE